LSVLQNLATGLEIELPELMELTLKRFRKESSTPHMPAAR
jgi:hypothetical protein